MALYSKIPYVGGEDTSVLQTGRKSDKTVAVKPDLPGNVIVIHGVNDVGVGFSAVEEGLCAGLNKRLSVGLVPAGYRMPTVDDKGKLVDDPDALFFKRHVTNETFSPVIPFYWGYREETDAARAAFGQRTDRNGNRLDKDLSKGGGPFANATGTIPDMWNRGTGAPTDPVGDPIRPVLNAPGRMYMILAAKRLAALISMIRDYDENEVVSIVAHSQGTVISLLAQAFLLDMGARPADTLVLVNSPYSLEARTTGLMAAAEVFSGQSNTAMTSADYAHLDGRQSLNARLDTLINIVQGVARKKSATPVFATLDDHAKHCGMVGAKWVAGNDRDNRGKVYVYFSPEDMTVALDHLHGIGWQGIADFVRDGPYGEPGAPVRPAMAELTTKVGSPPASGFYQRVFTFKRRFDLATKKEGPVLLGRKPPYDFALRLKKEDMGAHVAADNRGHRGTSRGVDWPVVDPGTMFMESKQSHAEFMREGIRTINGEELPTPVAAQLRAGEAAIPAASLQAKRNLPRDKQGPCEEVDPIDAAIAVASAKGYFDTWVSITDPGPVDTRAVRGTSRDSPVPHLFQGKALERSDKVGPVQKYLNEGKPVTQQCVVIQVFSCQGSDLLPTKQLLVKRKETPDEARMRWQNEVSPKSFHGAIFGNKANHANVTAYDVAIGGGLASSHPIFYAYLCAVADWRLKIGRVDELRDGIFSWKKFLTTFAGAPSADPNNPTANYWSVEPKWRKDVIEGNARYYSSGVLPACVPSLTAGLPTAVICQRTADKTAMPHASRPIVKPVARSVKPGATK
ncbi:T6SS effector phospholipase Tle3 domain-containing protein [Massilia sp. TWP1-3-3]|uniref:T6SS effector phospholipase Tle3 domain-containing protein n=1 Tax=Massilia sp. TWP1-3-3 TaxID=2804573 RepID=UPI003CEC607E